MHYEALLDAITDAMRKKLVRYLRWRCGCKADVDDAVQEAILSFCDRDDIGWDDETDQTAIKDEAALFRHLYLRAKKNVWNTTRRGYRRREVTAHPELILDESPTEARSFEATLELRKVLAGMSPTERQLARLRFSMGLKTDDIARILGKSPCAVRTAIRRMRLRLRFADSSVSEVPTQHRPVRRRRRRKAYAHRVEFGTPPDPSLEPVEPDSP